LLRMTGVERHDTEFLGDIPPVFFRKYLHELADWIADYRETIDQRAVAPNEKPGAIISKLSTKPPETGELIDDILADVYRVIVPGVVHWGHPQFAGYFGATSTAPGVLAEMISAALNLNCMTWRTSPAATELETLVLDWLRQWLGLPNEFGGVVYDTASIGIMHALAIAREEAVESIRSLGLAGRENVPMFRIYASDQAHSSVEKAVIALGLGENNVMRIASDPEFRMDVSVLSKAIAKDRQQNYRPLAIVATVGTTSTASVDPVREIASLCREQEIFLHIDAAYGGGLALLPECAWIKDGWNEADSLVINPHKMLFVPFDFSVLYVRDLKRLRRVFSLVPEYLRGDSVGADINYMDYGVQLGRRFRAIKAWMVWRTFGRAGMAARIREHLRLARLFAEWVQHDPRFELSAPVVMGVVCFRLRGSGDDDNSAVVEKINASGKAYLTQTKLRGRTAIRLGLGNILTTEQHLRNVWDLIQEGAGRGD
jgi:aromatic-L-amino-acid/L-tryptophan decarboxylase